MTSTRRLALVGFVLVAALGFLVYKGLTSALVYFRTASEAMAQRAQLGTSVFQLEGTVVRGTVHRVGVAEVSFEIRQGGATIHVENRGDPPQMFRPGLPVVVVGHFVAGSDRFVSDQIMVKHSQQYIAAHPNRVRASSGT
ncbi:MAG TPA: cytochrome c maturation protein CcmE [Acidimicrobiales bacterium]|nr:cytochrome c maturation protein CcmE [Acidimicrobiales bacterium]